MTIPPSWPECAPRQAAAPSEVKQILPNGCGRASSSSRDPIRVRPAMPIPAITLTASEEFMPASSAAHVHARMTEAQAFPTPSRVVAGPESPCPRTLPASSTSRARQPVPPPSTPRKSFFLLLTFFMWKSARYLHRTGIACDQAARSRDPDGRRA